MTEPLPLHEHLLSAADSRLRRVVAVVDALPARGEADALIAPLRPRLARLRPARPITLTRLLFAPVEPLIVPAEAWHPGSPAIPRPLLTPLGEAVREALGDAAADLLRRGAGRTMADAATVAELGADLWPRAAALLPGCPVVAAPERAGVVGPLAVLLGEGAALHRLPSLPGAAAAGEAERLLRGTAPAGVAALAMMLALLMRRLPRAQRLLHFADALAPADARERGSASERVLAYLLGDVRAAVPPDAALPHAAEQVRRTARMLEDLQAAADAAQRPARLAQVREARQHLAVQCRERVATAAELLAAPIQAPAEPADLAAMEDTARALRRLDAVGRRLGEAEALDRALGGAAGKLVADPRLPRATRLRLAEILLGPDAALALALAGA